MEVYTTTHTYDKQPALVVNTSFWVQNVTPQHEEESKQKDAITEVDTSTDEKEIQDNKTMDAKTMDAKKARDTSPPLTLDLPVSPTLEDYRIHSSSSEDSMDTEESEESNASLLEVQIECIHTNNKSLQTQYEQMVQNQAHLEEQERAYLQNQEHVNKLLEQIKEYQLKSNYLQQQVYYQRSELDRLAEQNLAYQSVIEQHQKTIEDQEKKIENNHKVLAYDQQLILLMGQPFHTLPYANEVMTLARSNY